jgi:hypothetical protein
VIAPAPPTTEENPLAPAVDPRAHAAVVGDIQVVRNRDLRPQTVFGRLGMPIAASLNNSDGGEQSVATGPGGRAVMYTTNNGDGISTDGGFSFTYLNPATAFGAASSPAGGYCCDQVVTYIPQVKRFVWVLQYWVPGAPAAANPKGVGMIRVASTTLQSFLATRGTTWRIHDFYPADFGLVRYRKGQIILDRAHIAYTRSNLYLTVDDFRSATDFRGTIMWRIGVRELGKASIGYQYIELPKASSKVRPAQDASEKDRVQYFAGAATNSKLNIYKWSDTANPITEYDMDHATVATDDTATNDPSGTDWMSRYGKQAGEIVTGAKTGNTLLFGWMYGRKATVKNDKGKDEVKTLHNQPGLGFLVINSDQDPPLKVAGSNIEFANYAAALPLLRANTNGATALSFMWGGPGRYPSHAVGFLIGYAMATTVSGRATSTEANFGGDYVGLTNVPGTQCFAAAGSATKLDSTGTSYIDPHYIYFGHTESNCTVPVIPPPPPPPSQPDLIVSSITSSGGQIAITVKNNGNAAASASKLGYGLNTFSFSLFDIQGLAPGETATAVLNCPNSGSVNVGAVADETHLVTESDETNNGSSATVNCVVAPPAQPDLVVTQVYGDQSSTSCTIFADVENIGTAPAPATMTEFKDANPSPPAGRDFDQFIATPALDPGQSTTVSFPRSYGQDNAAVVTADATQLVAESDENNNTNTGSGFPSTNYNCHYP